FDNANATCGAGAKGLDTPFKLDVAQRSRARVVEHSTEIPAVVHLRRVCADEQTEVACSDTGIGSEEATFVGLLNPGSYTVWADAKERDASGHYTILAELGPEQGAGTQGDGCGDAVPLNPNDHSVQGDTFAAKDDLSGKCGGAGAADVVYRVELP